MTTNPHVCARKKNQIKSGSPSLVPTKTLYKTQIREVKGDCDQKSKQCKEMQRRLAEYKEER